MDVDGDDDGVQRPREVESYGLDVDFETLEAEDREVSSGQACCLIRHCTTKILMGIYRMALMGMDTKLPHAHQHEHLAHPIRAQTQKHERYGLL